MATSKRLADKNVIQIFDCIHSNKIPPSHLKFTIVPIGPNGLKLTPPSIEFEDGLYIILKPDKKGKKGDIVCSPKVPSNLKHLVSYTLEKESKPCPWSLSGPQFPNSTSTQQRYCYPRGDFSYSNSKGGALWTMYKDDKEDLEYRLLHVYHSKKRATNQSAKVKKRIDNNQCVKRKSSEGNVRDENQLLSPIQVSITSSNDNDSPALLSASSNTRFSRRSEIDAIPPKEYFHGISYSSSCSTPYSNHWDNGSYYSGGRGEIIEDPYRGNGTIKQTHGTGNFHNNHISPYYRSDSCKPPSSINTRHCTSNHRPNQIEHYSDRYRSNAYHFHALPSSTLNSYHQPVVPQSYSSRIPADSTRKGPNLKAQRSIREKLSVIEKATKLSPMRKKQKLNTNHDDQIDNHATPEKSSSLNPNIWSNEHSPKSTKNQNDSIESPASQSASSFDLFRFGDGFFDSQLSWEKQPFVNLENIMSSPSFSSLASPISSKKIEYSKTSLTKTLNQFHESIKQNIESHPKDERENMLQVISNWAKKISIEPMGSNFA